MFLLFVYVWLLSTCIYLRMHIDLASQWLSSIVMLVVEIARPRDSSMKGQRVQIQFFRRGCLIVKESPITVPVSGLSL